MSKYYLLPYKTVCSELLKALFHNFAVNKLLCQYKGVHIDGMLSDMSDTSTYLLFLFITFPRNPLVGIVIYNVKYMLFLLPRAVSYVYIQPMYLYHAMWSTDKKHPVT